MRKGERVTTPGAAGTARRFPVSFDRPYGALSRVIGLEPARAYVEVSATDVVIRMGWAFRATFPRSAVAAVAEAQIRPISRGVHGFAGRWLVNGSGHGIVSIQLSPRQRGYVLGVPVRLRELMVSVTDPSGLVAKLTTG